MPQDNNHDTTTMAAGEDDYQQVPPRYPIRATHVELQRAVRSEQLRVRPKTEVDALAEHRLLPPTQQQQHQQKDLKSISTDELKSLIEAKRQQKEQTEQQVGVEKNAASTTKSEKKEEVEMEEYIESSIVLRPSSALHTQPAVIHRQLAPLYRARTYEQAQLAMIEANMNIRKCGAFADGSEVIYSFVDSPTPKPELEGNEVLEVTKELVEPTLVQKLFKYITSGGKKGKTKARAVGAAAGGIATADHGDNDDDDDEEEGDDDDDDDALGGLPGVHIPALPLKVTAYLREKRLLGGSGYKVSTTTEGKIEQNLTLRITNPLGYAETIEAEASTGVSDGLNEQAYRLNISAPDLITLGSRTSVQIFQHQHPMTMASCLGLQRGTRFDWLSANTKHRLIYELTDRQLHATSMPDHTFLGRASEAAQSVFAAPDQQHHHTRPKFLDPSPHILAMTSPWSPFRYAQSRKSSVKYAYSHSTLDHPFIPGSGFSLSSSVEFAGFGGDAKFIKLESGINTAVPITSNLSITSGLRAAYLHNMNASQPRTFLTDRLFPPQSLVLRGYASNFAARAAPPVGPAAGLDSLGGEFLLSTGAGVVYRTPVGAHFHAFWNAGNLLGLSTSTSTSSSPTAPYDPTARFNPSFGCAPVSSPLLSHFESFLSGTKQSVGMGVVVPSPIGRFELNVTKPFGSKPKVEFGIGIEWT